uniref:Uncharacterized protein n=1 Tax=Romanomermis culicivorax TaxID=13658 RepID=A0A915IKY2_ROMCU
MCVIRQSGCFPGQTWFDMLHGTGQQGNSEYWSCRDDERWLSGHSVVAVVDIGAMGGSNAAIGDSAIEDDVAGSTSIGGGGGSRTLNTGFSRFFKASKRF